MQQSYIQELQEDFDTVLNVAIQYAEKDKVFPHNLYKLNELKQKHQSKSNQNKLDFFVREILCSHTKHFKMNNKLKCWFCYKEIR